MYLEDCNVVNVECWLAVAEDAKVTIDRHGDPADDWNAGQDIGHQTLAGPCRDPGPGLIRWLRRQRDDGSAARVDETVSVFSAGAGSSLRNSSAVELVSSRKLAWDMTPQRR